MADNTRLGHSVAAEGTGAAVRFEHAAPRIGSRLLLLSDAAMTLEVASLPSREAACAGPEPLLRASARNAGRDTGQPLTAPTGMALLGQMPNIFDETIDGKPPPVCASARAVQTALAE
ncbi:hypothetical protein [Defluviimonas sp. WL0075]|uniref:Uncharacterized protein n=1 Tax=Albidovulum sediminicola TaxID=2984331 RepID=A0ABT2Z237_9RHOB|nr:hypothetical protein [Defluviimonas sp. WL0075]MCV2865072.1 hypothetical protein [Defluviimonas sp. WL0075]